MTISVHKQEAEKMSPQDKLNNRHVHVLSQGVYFRVEMSNWEVITPTTQKEEK